MGLVAVTEAVERINQVQVNLTEADKEFVVQFAFRTDDAELTGRLIDELCVQTQQVIQTQQAALDKDSEAVRRKYETMMDFKPDWIQKIENLLIALEMYRVQEEKTIKSLTEILSAYSISVTDEELKKKDIKGIKTRHIQL